MTEQYSWFFEPRHFAFNPDMKTDYSQLGLTFTKYYNYAITEHYAVVIY